MILNRKKIQEPQIFRLKTDLYMYISLVVKEGENSYYTCIVGSKIRTQQISIHYHFIYSNLSKTIQFVHVPCVNITCQVHARRIIAHG